MKKSDFELYATKNTVVVVKGKVKRQILRLLQERSLGFDEIVEATHKAKSTISKHLQELEEEGLIASFEDRADRRKKHYALKSRLVGISAEGSPSFDRKTIEDVASALGDPAAFINAVMRSIRYKFDSLGMDVAPTLYQLGTEIGTVIARDMRASDLKGVIEEVKRFWESHDLGNVEVLSEKPLTFIVTNCYECSDMPNVGRTLCAFDEGIVSAILQRRLGQPYRAKEIECAGTGHDHCKFLVTPR
ncbi:MAG: ArsR family transcriptional regulator [Methanobacteriota archaeon]|nr:MAG: ArsR family transcriptional regulator [Euryarchaeota archaeon]